ncbi:glycosyltransferase family 4 protein, partial [Patescibacteria group bacterium]|nr:glycosyltransferase family 4 protein [Patescibacteria group bacterium]
MKRILISCTYYEPNISGVTVYARILAEKMVGEGFDITVLSSRFQKNLAKQKTKNGVKIKRSRVLFRLSKGVFMPFFWLDAIKEVKKTDIVNCHLPQVESFILAILAKIFKKRLIVTHHCEFGIDGLWHNKIIGLVTYPFHFLTYLLADKIVSYTKDYAYVSIFLRFFKKKLIFVLPPAVVGKENKLKIKEILRSLELPWDDGESVILSGSEESQMKCLTPRGSLGFARDDSVKIIGYVGRIGWEKGLNFLIMACKKINEKRKVKLVLVGPYKNVAGDGSYKKLKRLIEKNKDFVVLLGAINHNDLANFYKICDCLVLPSTNNLETFGIVQIEAMVSGCGVVASDLPGVRIPVRLTGMGKIAKIGDSNDLAKKIEQVLESKYSKKQIKKAREIF